MVRPIQFPNYIDSVWATVPATSIKKVKSFDELLPDSARIIVNQRAQAQAGSISIGAESVNYTLRDRDKQLRRHKIEWHKKITLSLACIVLFIVGAPLGAIIRKGGLGTPLVFAIIFFMLFYFSSTTGEKFVKEDTMSPFTGMWLATFILLPIGLFLTYKAMRDSHLFNKEFYHRIRKAIIGKKGGTKT